MELNDTILSMNSQDYKERFKAEYYQLSIRYRKLNDMYIKYKNGELNFEPTCPISTYEMQLKAMAEYKAILEARAKMENIDL